MNIILKVLIILLLSSVDSLSQTSLQHYIFFNIDRERIQESSFLNTTQIKGAQLKYRWSELEPEKDKYNFDLIQKDLDFLKANGKRLFIQLQDVSFDTSIINVPRYLLEDPVYNGGVAVQVGRNEDGTEYLVEGLVARRWDKAVANRFHKLLAELGNRFDGKLEGLNLPETSIGLGTADMHPKGFTYEIYRDAIKENMKMMKAAFPNSTVILYANFMPGESLPDDDHNYLKDLYSYAREIKVGMGGPDIKVYKWFQMKHSYGLIRDSYGIIPTGAAVQWGNYDLINPKTGKQVTIPEIHEFGRDYLRLNYIFWSTQEPYYSEFLIPYLKKLEK